MRKMRWWFSSKFHTLSSSTNTLKIGLRIENQSGNLKVGSFLRHSVVPGVIAIERLMPGFQHYVAVISEPYCRCRPSVTGVRISVSVAVLSACDEIGLKPLSVAMNVKRRKHRLWMR